MTAPALLRTRQARLRILAGLVATLPAVTLGSGEAGAACAAPVAMAQPTASSGAVSARESMARALLGGQPSRLGQISARQGGAMAAPEPEPAYAALEPSAGPEIILSARAVASLPAILAGWAPALKVAQGAAGGQVPQFSIVPEGLRSFVATASLAQPLVEACDGRWSAQPAVMTVNPVHRAGAVDFFGSVAMPISHTPLDAKWASVAAPLPREGMWSPLIEAGRRLDPRRQVEAVNRWVNARLHFEDDIRISGQADQWSTAARSLSRGTGDCEDYAIAKLRLLEAMGFDRRALFLVIARDLVRRADHAILVARVDGEPVVLDNMTDRLVSALDASDYRPIITFGAAGRWTHGYRVTPEPLPVRRQYASLQ